VTDALFRVIVLTVPFHFLHRESDNRTIFTLKTVEMYKIRGFVWCCGWISTFRRTLLPPSFIRVDVRPPSPRISTLKMETARSSETSISNPHTTWRNNAENHEFYHHRTSNLVQMYILMLPYSKSVTILIASPCIYVFNYLQFGRNSKLELMSHIEGVSTHASYKRALILALWPTM